MALLISTLNLALLLSLCVGNRIFAGWRSSWWRSSRSNVMKMSSSGSPIEMTSQQFNCIQDLAVSIAYFELNVTLNSSAYLEKPNIASLSESATDRKWHYLTSQQSLYPAGDLDVRFTLIFNDTPYGNCSFLFQENDGSSTNIYPNITMMASCDENMTSQSCSQSMLVTTTPEVVGDFDNTNVNNTNSTSVNGSKCLCPCECAFLMSKERSEQMMAAILEDLRIPKFSTSFSKRKLSSAPDYRISCTGIGLVGVFVLVAVFGLILIGDLNLFLFNARTALSHIRGHYGF